MSDQWIAMSYRVPTEPSRNRVHVWRRMKELGAVYLQQGMAVLPDLDELRNDLQRLRNEILEMSGEAAILTLGFAHAEDETRLRADFCALRDQEYDEVIDKCSLLLLELEQETTVEKFTFAEIEENEAELLKITRWMQRIATRDYFGAPKQEVAQEMIRRASERAATYAEEVYRREIPVNA